MPHQAWEQSNKRKIPQIRRSSAQFGRIVTIFTWSTVQWEMADGVKEPAASYCQPLHNSQRVAQFLGITELFTGKACYINAGGLIQWNTSCSCWFRSGAFLSGGRSWIIFAPFPAPFQAQKCLLSLTMTSYSFVPQWHCILHVQHSYCTRSVKLLRPQFWLMLF